MKTILLLLLLAAPARAQVLPEDEKDPSQLKNLEFLYEEIRRERIDRETAAAATASAGVIVSTFGFIPAYNGVADTNADMGPSVRGSTLTIVTTSSGRHLIRAILNFYMDSGGNTQCTFLRNGAFVSPMSATKGNWVSLQGTSEDTMTLVFPDPTVLPAGTYVYSLTCSNAGTSYRACPSSIVADSATACYLEVSTIP